MPGSISAVLSDRNGYRLDAERRRRYPSSERMKNLHCGDVSGIKHHADLRKAGGDLLEQVEPFSADGKFEGAETGDVAAGRSQAVHKSLRDRIGD